MVKKCVEFIEHCLRRIEIMVTSVHSKSIKGDCWCLSWPTKCVLTLSLPNKLSAKFLTCFNFQCASMSLKVGEKVVWVSNSLDQGKTELLGVSSGSKLFAYGTLVASDGLRVNHLVSSYMKHTKQYYWTETSYQNAYFISQIINNHKQCHYEK